MLKEKLREIKANGYRPIDGDMSLLNTMLDHIGDVDDDLRDDLIYTTLAKWIMNDLDAAQKKMVLKRCLENLNTGLGETGTDTVFIRTFSILQIPVLLYTHQQDPYLNAGEILMIVDAVNSYLDQEIDLRGFISGKGWAHAVAHTADALKHIGRLDEISEQQALQCLKHIKDKMSVDYYGYVNDEDERMTLAVISLFDHLTEHVILNWLDTFKHLEKKQVLTDDMMAQMNCKRFLRCIYFRTPKPEIKEKLIEVLTAIDRYK